MIELPRRRFLSGLIGLIASPAIVRVSSLMPVNSIPLGLVVRTRHEVGTVHNGLLTVDMITREAVRLWKNSNAFLENLDSYPRIAL